MPNAKFQIAYFAFIFALLFFVLPVLSGCNGEGNSAELETPSFTIETYPRVDGSTVTIPLSEAVAATLTGMKLEEERQLAEDAGVSLEVIPVVSEAFVFLVNADNSIAALTQDEIRDIGFENLTIFDF